MIPHAGPVMPATASGLPAFGHFKPSFVYRYVRVPGITSSQARQLGIVYAQRAIAARAPAGIPDRRPASTLVSTRTGSRSVIS
jgi:hypothetical protein